MLQPVSALDQIHALLLTGGGPMALGATAGVVRFLEERGVGYDWGVPNVRVPIVVWTVFATGSSMPRKQPGGGMVMSLLTPRDHGVSRAAAPSADRCGSRATSEVMLR